MHKRGFWEKNAPIQHNIQGTVRKGRTSLSIFSGKDFGQIVKNGGIFGKNRRRKGRRPGGTRYASCRQNGFS